MTLKPEIRKTEPTTAPAATGSNSRTRTHHEGAKSPIKIPPTRSKNNLRKGLPKHAATVSFTPANRCTEVLRFFDVRLMTGTLWNPVNDAQAQRILTWAHEALLAFALFNVGKGTFQALEQAKQYLPAVSHALGSIRRLLCGEAKLYVDKNLLWAITLEGADAPPAARSMQPAFSCHSAEPGCSGGDQIAKFHREIAAAARRTRPHADAEIEALLHWVDASFITQALAALGMVHAPDSDSFQIVQHVLDLVLQELFSIEWFPDRNEAGFRLCNTTPESVQRALAMLRAQAA